MYPRLQPYVSQTATLCLLRWESLLGARGAGADGAGHGLGGHGSAPISIRYLSRGTEGEGEGGGLWLGLGLGLANPNPNPNLSRGAEGEGGLSKPKTGVGAAKHGKVDPDG